MRCLARHGWINFRMRAMVVSFAVYNLWLDWKVIGPHLARTFLDYEPGTHYPQLQMQSGTTGINAMRCYNVVKQGKDQDLYGTFIRKYVGELGKVGNEYIHEPWRIPRSIRRRCKIRIGGGGSSTMTSTTTTTTSDEGLSASTDSIGDDDTDDDDWSHYPERIVDDQVSARIAKAKVAAIKKLGTTKAIANTVYQKHGSRSKHRDAMEGGGGGGGSKKSKALSTMTVPANNISASNRQPKITTMFAASNSSSTSTSTSRSPTIGEGDKRADCHTTIDAKLRTPTTIRQSCSNEMRDLTTNGNSTSTTTVEKRLRVSYTTNNDDSNLYPKTTNNPKTWQTSNKDGDLINNKQCDETSTSVNKRRRASFTMEKAVKIAGSTWSCTACTFMNEKVYGLVCSLCATPRVSNG